ncbi:hypothetical protein [Vagococcus carniphilus]|uniref:Uncharacterized protein n=1 Tax=Vagococcus carniphilus TaxID=218144 RepID=A0A430AYU4_9ENTE|nr:hypothetical protein [Vagococcus carniphilus]QNN72035.1 hypothetical protein H9L18_09040 [Vagococcus carniphilus]RSU13231.1 hypothetical protein CBF28_10235 [Vagococcus carniphilus]
MKKSFVKKMIVTSILLAGIVFGTKVEASNQGPYIKDGSMVQVTKKNYDMWQNFGWKKKNNTNNVYQKTFQARGRYQHENGQTYYSLFDSKGMWYGYLNSNATKKTSRQGNYISDGSYVVISKANYELWQNFGWKYKKNTNNILNQVFSAQGRYQHFNGSTYYSLYDNKGTWYGYLNASATKKTNPQGAYISDGRYVQITKNYELWQNFNWKKKGNGASYYNQGLQARGRYQHFNGNTYYSLFNDKGAWLGYINANATTQYRPKQTKSTKTVNKDTDGRVLSSTKGYKYVSESTDGGQTTKRPNGDMHTTYTKIVIWEVDPTMLNPGDYGGKYTSNSELILGTSEGVHYSGVGNIGATFTTQRNASLFALDTIADSGRGGTYTTWEVKFKDGIIAYTTSVFLK